MSRGPSVGMEVGPGDTEDPSRTRHPIPQMSLDIPLERLQAIARIVVEEPDADALVQRLAEAAASALSGDVVAVGLHLDGRIRIDHVVCQGELQGADRLLAPGEDVAGWLLEHRRPLFVPDLRAPLPDGLRFIDRWGAVSLLAVPILNHQEHLLGTLECYRRDPERPFTAAHLALARTIALLAAAGLERAQLFAKMLEWAASFENLLAFNASLNAQLEPTLLLRRLVEHASGFLGAEAGMAGLVGAQDVVVDGYWHRGRWVAFRGRWPAQEGTPGWVVRNQCPYLTNDYPRDRLANPLLARRFQVVNAICVPVLGLEEEVLGFVELHNRKGGREPFTWSDVDFLESLTNSTALALRNANLLAELEAQRGQLRALAARQVQLLEEERRRIARELHDEAGQALVGIKLGLQVLAQRLPPEAVALREELDSLRRQVNRAAAQLRDIARELRPPTLDELGLEAALRQCILAFRKRTRLTVHFDSLNLVQVPQAVETACYRIVQEALTNVARHAQASQVWITLVCDDQGVHLTIRDDGQGFDMEEVGRHGLGLIGMQERAKMLDGTLQIDSAPGVGTVIQGTIPLG